MKFKMAPEVLAVLVLFIVVIFIANYGSCRRDPVPWKGTFSKHSPYREGFDSKPKGENEKREAFTPLSPAPLDTSSWSTIDKVGGLPSSAECIGNSFGYTKGAGGICFDADTKKLLLSRGGQGN